MEDVHRRHKEVPFGWVVWLGQAVAKVRRRLEQRAAWSDPPRPAPPGDLHHLSAPH